MNELHEYIIESVLDGDVLSSLISPPAEVVSCDGPIKRGLPACRPAVCK